MWSLFTSGIVRSVAISDHLYFIHNNLTHLVKELRNEGKLSKVRISVIVTIEERDEGVSSWEDEIDTTVLDNVVSMGASLSFVVTCPLRETVG